MRLVQVVLHFLLFIVEFGIGITSNESLPQNFSGVCIFQELYLLSHAEIAAIQAEPYISVDIEKENCTGNIPFDEFKVLEAMYDSMGGEFWTWNNDDPHLVEWDFEGADQTSYPNPCADWQGVICSSNGTVKDFSKNCSIQGISLIEYNLSGFLPVEAMIGLRDLNTLNL